MTKPVFRSRGKTPGSPGLRSARSQATEAAAAERAGLAADGVLGKGPAPKHQAVFLGSPTFLRGKAVFTFFSPGRVSFIHNRDLIIITPPTKTRKTHSFIKSSTADLPRPLQDSLLFSLPVSWWIRKHSLHSGSKVHLTVKASSLSRKISPLSPNTPL